ncbi:MAG: hypothetical protein HY457_00735 [Parcubacteria group bacterium]|nr:hypothetical protein [Parcubacteria group bacterium]
MNEGQGKAFVRKYPPGHGRQGETTMLLVLVKGDIPELTNEAMHAIEVSANEDGSLKVQILGAKPAPELVNARADEILTERM